VVAEEFLGHVNIFIRKIVRCERGGTLVPARVLKMLAIERAVDSILALRATAHRADVAADTGTVPSRALFLTDFAKGVHQRIPLSYHRDMRRTDLYIKVELDLDEHEKPERVASDICRLIRKVYGVRSAEVSNMVEKD